MKKTFKSLLAVILILTMVVPSITVFATTTVPYKKTGTVYTISGKNYYQAETTNEYNGVAKGSKFWLDSSNNIVTDTTVLNKIVALNILATDNFFYLTETTMGTTLEAARGYYDVFTSISSVNKLGTIVGTFSGTTISLMTNVAYGFTDIAIDIGSEVLSTDSLKTVGLITMLKIYANNCAANLNAVKNLRKSASTNYDSLLYLIENYAESQACLAAIIYLAGDEIQEYVNSSLWNKLLNYFNDVLGGIADSVIPDEWAIEILNAFVDGTISVIPLTELTLSTNADKVFSQKKQEVYNSQIKVLNKADYSTLKNIADKLTKTSQNNSPKYPTGTYKPSYAEGLNMRSGASTSKSVVGAIKQSTKFTVTEVSGNWGYTTSGGKSGWVCLDYATFIDSSTENESQSTTSKYNVGTYKPAYAEGLNMRSGASTSNSIVGAIKQSTKFTVTKISGNWGYTTSGGKSGWVCLDYATYINSSTEGEKIYTNIMLTDSNVDSYVGKKIVDIHNASVTTKITKSGKESTVTHNPYVYDGYCENGSKQCVDYVWARTQEKLKFRPNWVSGHAKEIASLAPNDRKITSAENIEYTVKVNLKDNGSDIKANSLVCFGPVTGNQYGHVIYVEHVKTVNNTTYIYYTHGGSVYYDSGVSGTLYKKSLDELLKTWGKYTGTVSFVERESVTNEESVELPSVESPLPGTTAGWSEWSTSKPQEKEGRIIEALIQYGYYHYVHTWTDSGFTGAYPIKSSKPFSASNPSDTVTYHEYWSNERLTRVTGWTDGKNDFDSYPNKCCNLGTNVSTVATHLYDADKTRTIYRYKDEELKKYVVTYDTNGGSSIPSQTKTQNIALNLSSTIPTKDGYIFKGWSTTANGNVAYSSGSKYTTDADITLYAIWQKEENEVYYIIYNANGGQNAPSMQTKNEDEDIAISDITPTRNGYIFKGWTTENGGKVKYNSKDIYKENKTVYLHAVWEAVTYTVTYNANGGKNSLKPQKKIHDEYLVLSEIIPVKEGFTFVNWYDGVDVYNPGSIFEKNADTILSAVWKKEEEEKFPFVDVPEDAWYKDDVKNAYEKGIVNGKGENRYAPEDNMTYAEAIKIACTIYQLYNDGEVSLKNGKEVWYSTFMEYAIENGIIRSDYSAVADKKITRKDFVNIFYGALPVKEFTKINNVGDNSIPDVKIGDAYSEEIYTFYRAGILTGSDSKGSFMPDSNIKRNEVCAIVTRMLDSGARKETDL